MKIKDIDFHRNGISGEPFYISIIEDTAEKRDMLAITFYGDESHCRTAVLDVDLLKDKEIRFGYNSWRPEKYHDLMIKTIKENR